MPGSEEQDKKISQSLFDQEVVGTDDILHSVAVVKSYWAEEKARRRRLALTYGLPVVVILLTAYLGTAKYYKFFPFAEKPAWLTAPAVPDAGLPERVVVHTEGNPEALIKIIVTHPEDGELEQQAQKVLHEALDLKPSEFYLQFRIADNLPKEEREDLISYDGHSVTINDQSKFVFGDPERPDRVIDLMGFCPLYYTPEDLAEAVNYVYREVYGAATPLLDLKALGLEPGGEGDAQAPATKRGAEDGQQGEIKLRLPEIKVDE